MARVVKPTLVLSEEDRNYLTQLHKTRTEPYYRVERARILLHYADGLTVSKIAEMMNTTIPKVSRCVDKAIESCVQEALEDSQRSGRPTEITPEAITWIISLACQKPKDLGYSYEVWTTRLLAEYVRKHAVSTGHPSVARMAAGSISRLMASQEIQPHKVTYYLKRRDPEFDAKMVQVLHVYKQVEMVLEDDQFKPICDIMLSYDEKPGIQAIGNTAEDLPPVAGQHATIGRDPEYVRHGTLSLLAGIDLVTGEVIGSVEDRHRSKEFVEFLKKLDAHYAPGLRIQIVLDNHSAHTSKETKAYLETVPDRFEFVFTPKHGSWLNVIESFFAKMTKQVLRHIRVKSKEELKERLELYLEEINEAPTPFRWRYGLDSLVL